MGPFFHTLLKAYGSFLYFRSPEAHWLLVAATLVNPAVGILGLWGGIVSLSCRKGLALPNQVYDLDVVNGVLLGLMVGTFFAATPESFALATLSGLLATLASRLIHALVSIPKGLPILSAPLFLAGLPVYAFGRALALPWAVAPAANPVDLWLYQWLPTPVLSWLIATGQIYFSPTPVGGILVGLAIFLSSRRLFLIILSAYVVVRTELALFGVTPYSLPLSLASTAAMLTALMTGGVFARPGNRPFLVAGMGAAIAGLLSLAAFNIFYFLGLPPLSLPFVATTWFIMVALSPISGEPWSRYWLDTPRIPEAVAASTALAEARGVAEGSIGLRLPFFGAWQIYQGFDGAHTHQGEWRHALDFHQVVDGLAYRGDGRQCTDYHCFNAAICSPVTGLVVACRDDLPDTPPGTMDTNNNWGNFILIALSGTDHLLLSHLRQGSLTISPQTTVTPGQILARCGNSGRSVQPHLHMHVQTGPWLGNPTRPFHLTHTLIPMEPSPCYSLDHIPTEGTTVGHPRPGPLLAHSLYRAVGRSFTYAFSGRHAPLKMTVAIDLAGETWLVVNQRTRVAFVQTDTLIAFYQRDKGDPRLDALLLTTALTPLCEEAIHWHDSIPVHWLPLPWWLRTLNWLFPGFLKEESLYDRLWQPLGLCWEQRVEHRVTWMGKSLWSCHGQADLSESLGWLRLSLVTPRETMQGTLVRHGMQSDHGIVGWEKKIGD
ncbi:MAG: urea transporter [Magnetococcales bacterium]|nr:urea transporter [Magnetococcales bacterium]